MTARASLGIAAALLALLSACSRSELATADPLSKDQTPPPPPAEIDRTCDDAAYPSDVWAQCEQQNYAHVSEAPAEQVSNPDFDERWRAQGQANLLEWIARATADPSWAVYPSGNSPQTPLCTTWGLQCSGDPFRYADFDGPERWCGGCTGAGCHSRRGGGGCRLPPGRD